MYIGDDIGIEGLEALYEELSALDRPSIFLYSASKIQRSFSLEAGVIQLLLTSLNRNPDTEIRILESEKYMSDFCGYPFGVIAASLCDALVEKRTGNKVSDFTSSRAKEIALEFVGRMDRGVYRGTSPKSGAMVDDVNLVCITNLKDGGQYQFIRPLYALPKRGAIRGRLDYALLVARVLATLSGTAKEKISQDRVEAIGDIAHELIKNTDEHAMTNIGGDLYKKGARGITFKYVNIDRKEIQEPKVEVTSGAFSLYLMKRNIEMDSSEKRFKYLEISVFDNGPGMARRWLSHHAGREVAFDEFSLDQELEAVKKCFEKYATTKGVVESGTGLTRVAELIEHYRGFVRIRTGRLCLFMSPKNKVEPRGDIRLVNWFDKKELAAVEGTTLTICIPV